MNKLQELKTATRKSAKGIGKALPVIIGVVLLIGIMKILVPTTAYSYLFKNNTFLDPFVGSIIGSLLAGNPITSYILGGELLGQGVSLIAVTAFLVAWVTVGVVQIPAEGSILGKKFALIRNGICFFFSVLVALVTVGILRVI